MKEYRIEARNAKSGNWTPAFMTNRGRMNSTNTFARLIDAERYMKESMEYHLSGQYEREWGEYANHYDAFRIVCREMTDWEVLK